MAEVYLPSTLPPLFPGLPRRIELDAATVDEIVEQMAHIREWGGQFIIPIPRPQIIP